MSDLTYNLMKKGLDVSSVRQKTINSNISNINTPNYKVNKVEFEEYLANAANKIALRKTHQDHYGISTLDDIKPTVEKRETTFLNDNGNNVDVDYEMAELAANEIYHNVLVSQINAKLGNLNYVINR